MHDPTADLYKIMDEAGLDAVNFLSGKKSMSRIVSEVRINLHQALTAYLKERGDMTHEPTEQQQ